MRDIAVSYARDGQANASSGYAGEGDTAAVNSPAPNVLVMSLARDKQLESVRTYAVSADGREMTESAADVDDNGVPFVRNFRFTQGYLDALSNVEMIGSTAKTLTGYFGASRAPALKISAFTFTGVTEF